MLTTLLNRACTITTRAEGAALDAYGDPVQTTTTLETVCELQQTRRSEQDVGGELAESGWLLILPAGTPIALDDRVTVDGLALEVIGEPWSARNPRTQAVSHIEATVQRTASTGDA